MITQQKPHGGQCYCTYLKVMFVKENASEGGRKLQRHTQVKCFLGFDPRQMANMACLNFESALVEVRGMKAVDSPKYQQRHEKVLQKLDALRPLLASWAPLQLGPLLLTPTDPAPTTPIPAALIGDGNLENCWSFQIRLLFSAAGCSEIMLRTVADAVGLREAELGPGWMNVRSSSGMTVLHAAVLWGSTSSFQYLFHDLCTRAHLFVDGHPPCADMQAWQWLLFAHEKTYVHLEPLLFMACSGTYRHMIPGVVDRDMYINNCCDIACALVRELHPTALSQIWEDKDARVLKHVTCVIRAAILDYVPVLNALKERLDRAGAWAELVAFRHGDVVHDGRGGHIFGTCALSTAAEHACVHVVSWLLDNASWSYVDVAVALHVVLQDGLAISRERTMEIGLRFVDALLTRDCEPCYHFMISELLSQVLTATLSFFCANRPLEVTFLQRLVSDLRAPMVLAGPSSVLWNLWSSDGAQIVFRHIKVTGKAHLLTAPLNSQGTTLLIYTVKSRRRQVLDVLIEEICDLAPSEQVAAVCAKDNAGKTAGDYAASDVEHLELVELLETKFPKMAVPLEVYRRLATHNFADDFSPLANAIYKGFPAVITALLEAGADPLWRRSPGSRDDFCQYHYETALEVSMDTGSADTFQRLLRAVDEKANAEKTLRKCLVRASGLGHDGVLVAVLEALAARGHDCSPTIAAKNCKGVHIAPLQAAKDAGFVFCVEILTEFSSWNSRWSLLRSVWITAVVRTTTWLAK